MPVQAKQLASVAKETLPQQIIDLVQSALVDLVDQINQRPELYFTTTKQPANLKDGDLIVKRAANTVTISVANSRGTDPLTLPDVTSLQRSVAALSTSVTSLTASVTALTAVVATKLDAHSTNFKGLITNTSSGLTNFPNSGDWGFQNNSGTLSLNFNRSGTVTKVNITTAA